MTEKQYPQDLRNIWADANANYKTAVWQCLDAKKNLALASLRTVRGRCLYSSEELRALENEVARCEEIKEMARTRSREAFAALEKAEAEFYDTPTPITLL